MSTREAVPTRTSTAPRGADDPAPGARSEGALRRLLSRSTITPPLFGAMWLVYLSYPWTAAWRAPSGPGRVVSLVSVAVFALVFLTSLVEMRGWRRGGQHGPRAPHAVLYLAALAVLNVGMAVSAGEEALAGLVFLAVAAVFLLSRREAVAVVVVLTAAGEGLPRLLPTWESTDMIGIQIVLAAFAVFGLAQLMTRNAQLARARQEVADLAVSHERERLARDVHDLLGHSLTVITVKAELAGRLLGSDVEGAAREVADIERLARAALADVRATVSGIRATGLVNELASARAALEAAGIEAVLPGAVDEVDPRLRDLFGWSVREGVTNVLRHSGARRCEVLITPSTLLVRDDGCGPAPRPGDTQGAGNGLVGLRERAEAVGAGVSVGRGPDGGFELRVGAR
ncbi:sensor histidine kinase [Cellulomonas sp. P22]|uniref:sensor histidine kinase n=1 Tax=Cellulomonas sp. P22 TaxID=3373189 RepID=UPI0037B23381